MNASTDGSSAQTPGKKVLRLTRSEAASVALKVAVDQREGKTSPKWMLDVARRMGVQAS